MRDATDAAFPDATGRVLCGFTGRAGGVSEGPYAWLNLSYTVGDQARSVDANWQRLRASLQHDLSFVRMRQVHGCEVRVAHTAEDDLGDGDAVITAAASVAVGVLTADCVPILLSAAAGEVVGAVHAGWRGTAADVAGKTVHAIEKNFGIPARACAAAIGPAIGPCCYEVGEDVVAALFGAEALLAPAAFVEPMPATAGKFRVDLRAANVALLRRAGLEGAAIRQIGGCTCCGARTWFSHRAAGGAATGRQLSWIARLPA